MYASCERRKEGCEEVHAGPKGARWLSASPAAAASEGSRQAGQQRSVLVAAAMAAAVPSNQPTRPEDLGSIKHITLLYTLYCHLLLTVLLIV